MLPKVAIIGRPNVGKSSLLNLLAGRRVSIVEPTAGVTRDRITHEVVLPPAHEGAAPRLCEMIDTGGYGIYSDNQILNILTDDVEYQIGAALDESQLILFVTDAHTGITPLDEEIAQLLRKRVGKRVPILPVVNKVDDASHEPDALNASRLGFGQPVTVSSATKRGKFDLLDAIADNIDWSVDLTPPASAEMKLAIIGKRNAGKSTFVNSLAGAKRVIVSELPGTTRDSVDVRYQIDGHTFIAIDTAGVRKRKSLENDIEYYSLHRTLRSIRRADVVILLIDATQPISQVDKQLSSQIQKHFKPSVIVINKWDLVKDKLQTEEYLEYVADALRGLDYAPMVFTSAVNNDHVKEAALLAVKLHEQSSLRISTGELNQIVRSILQQRAPSSKLGRRAKVYYVTQTATNPPTIVMFANDPELFTEQYRRYIINEFREKLPFAEVPIKLLVRARQRTSHAAAGEASADEKPIYES